MKNFIFAFVLVLSIANTASASLVVDFVVTDPGEEGDESANSMLNCESAESTAALCASGDVKGKSCAVAEQVLALCAELY